MFNNYVCEVTHAYVQYICDNVKEIVPITFIKDFEPANVGDFSTKKIYKCFWKQPKSKGSGEFYDAHILKLGESANEIDEAVRLRRVATSMTTGAKEKPTLKKGSCSQLLSKKEAESMGNNQLMKNILAEKIKQRKDSPLIDHLQNAEVSVTTDSETTSSEQTSPDYKEKYHDKKKECKNLKRKLKEMEQTTPTVLQEEVEKLRKLNSDLQEHLLSLMKGKTNQFELNAENADLHDSTPLFEKSTPLFEKKDGQVHIGQSIWIDANKWDYLSQPGITPSMFTKTLAVAIWGSDELSKRSVMGMEANRLKSTVGNSKRQPLTPNKLKVVKSCLLSVLKTQKKDQEYINACVNNVTKYLNEKICTLRKSAGKSSARSISFLNVE